MSKTGIETYEYFLNHIKQEGKESMKCSKGYGSERNKLDGRGKCEDSGGC